MSTSSHERSFEPDPVAVRSAREFARAAVGDGAVPAQDAAFVDRLLLVVSELATNAVLHARTEFVVRVSSDGGAVRVAVYDSSSGRPAVGSMDPSAVTGRGLGIVESLASDWGIDDVDGGKWVWAELVPEGFDA
jgi:anti-sigma regulatory factor (Ser/Thr protein kinase)